MKKLFLAVLSFLFSLPAFAAGSHEHHHGHAAHHDYNVGAPAKPSAADYSINVNLMDNMRFDFEPGIEKIKHGDIVTFVVKNNGKVIHEFSIDDNQSHEKHRKAMLDNPNMKHTDPNTVSLAPGETDNMTWNFNKKGEVVFACNVPGHYESGMKKIIVIK